MVLETKLHLMAEARVKTEEEILRQRGRKLNTFRFCALFKSAIIWKSSRRWEKATCLSSTNMFEIQFL